MMLPDRETLSAALLSAANTRPVRIAAGKIAADIAKFQVLTEATVGLDDYSADTAIVLFAAATLRGFAREIGMEAQDVLADLQAIRPFSELAI